MAIGKTNIGGGGSYTGPKVIGSPTQPSNPKDNTVWVQTSTPISSWEMSEVATPGWDTAPAGFVYFTTSTSDWTVPNLVRFVKRNEGNVFLKATRCWQNLGTPGATQWTSMNAYIYHNDTWVQFSSVFSATINITYPAGSTCTCSDGTTTLSAPDTSGTWACTIPNAGTWTVTSTSGTESDSKAVSVTTDGQSISVELSYATYLYNLGNTCDALTGGWQAIGKYNRPIDNGGTKGSPSAVNGAASLNISLDSSCGLVVTKNKVALNNYKTLTFKGSVTTLGTCNLCIYSYLTGDYMPSYSASAAIGTTGASVECSLDVSAITGSYYIGLALENANTIAMKQLYLED